MKTLFLPLDIKKEICMHCEDSYPHEACGLLIGNHDGVGGYRVTAAISSPNLSPMPEKAFEIDPALIIHYQKLGRNQKSCRDGGAMIIGHYHSHPEGEAAPSIQDQDQNYDKNLIWVIIQVKDKRPSTINAFATDERSQQLGIIPLHPHGDRIGSPHK